ncbi:photosystem II S4 domain protein [Prochlorococcus marinus]|uniref:RNA-binding S4 domain-containing protein n=1 Tax=Prochlorococcus marinus (strain MIT 9211) TaxID=93059 RepID=A9BBY0_PROM4|nr:photosystem II S4 domain protein [Prochlorococcus marinus]ABX09342.1 Conserved hypothetical protein [Prochlorococcus marinus str. MIT 9211]
MKLISRDLIKRSKNAETLERLISLGEKAHKTWQELWSPFVEAQLIEEILKIFDPIHEINCHADGGYLGAERKRILFRRTHEGEKKIFPKPTLSGMQIEGNFLFDKTRIQDFKEALEEKGISPSDLGDIWIVGDRGAQLICTREAGLLLNKQNGLIREVSIKYELLDINQLRLPSKRMPKKITTIEASTRLDSISSAGFGLSRAKIVTEIKAGRIRLNWTRANQPFKDVKSGDRIHLEGKGSLLIQNIEPTKRARWRVVLQRE